MTDRTPPPDVTLRWLRWWADLLDSRFRIPGTRIRFGFDPILSLLPGIGDLASPVFATVLLVQGLHQGVPKVVLLRMLANALVDAVVGIVPIAGSVADVFWRANTTNMALLEEHARRGRPPSTGDYVFLFVVAAVFGMLALVPVLLALSLAVVFWTWLAQ